MSTYWLFVDMNSYFASVEQQLRPELRGQPVAVIPMLADTTCCIAASYEAKAFGVKTGTAVWEARERCPGIHLIPACTNSYVRFHERIVKAVNSVLPVDEVHSIDEMSCRLLGNQTVPEVAYQIGRQVKQAIYRQVGESLRCSVGLAPNRLLAKIATDLQKPDGLTLIRKQDLPDCLFSLQLDDLPGIGRQMLKRFHRIGVRTIPQLYQLSQPQLKQVWGGVIGERWWHLLRGEDLPEKPTQRRTVGHSHVLPPDYRTDRLSYEVLVKLTHKAAARLRGINYWASLMSIRVGYLEHWSWGETVKLKDVQDTQTMLDALAWMWERRPRGVVPVKVEITLHGLKSARSCPPPLFPEQQQKLKVARAMDAVNDKLGEGALYLAAMHSAQGSAPSRIAFRSIPECRPQHEDQPRAASINRAGG